jgi:hypothetical protein
MAKDTMKQTFNARNALNREISTTKREIQAMQKHKFLNARMIRERKIRLQALEEGAHDILTPPVAYSGSTSEVVNKNNYKTYAAQVNGAYAMYNCEKDYGVELTQGLVGFRTGVIAGEGLSVNSKNKKKLDFVEEFLEYNKLHGSMLMDVVTTGELEGKNLLLLKDGKSRIDKDKKVIKVSPFSWYINKYNVHMEPKDTDLIKNITYKDKKEASGESTILPDKAVYVRLGSMQTYDVNRTPNRLHAVLTQIENCSRAGFDLRENTHLYGKWTPTWKTQTIQEAKAINNDIESLNWEPGTGYAGTADFKYAEPGGGASDAIKHDMLTSLKYISLTMGIPIHFLSWPELMSNRATADALYEVVVISTKRDRLIWEESFKELINKACVLAVDEGIADNAILKGDIQVKLPIVSMALLKQLIEVWYPLLTDNIISEFTFRNMLPGINPIEEVKLVDKEKEKRMEDSPFNNDTTNNILNPVTSNEDNNNNDNKTVEENK